jgi:hypothetical protein
MPEFINGVECWSAEDRNAGLCHPRALWQPVAGGNGFGEVEGHSESVSSVEVSPTVPPADVLKADVMTAYKSVGGSAYLQRIAAESPSQFLKLLSRLLPQEVEVDVSGSVDVRHLSVAADRLFDVRRAHQLCQAYPFTTVLPDGRRVVEVGALSSHHLALLSGQAELPGVRGQHFVTFERAGERWLPVEVRDSEFALLEVKDEKAVG